MADSGIKKMIYARRVSDIADDEDILTSIMFPVESIRGYVGASADSYAILRFDQPYQAFETDAGDAAYIFLTVPTGAGQHRQLAADLAEEIAHGDDALIVLYDGVTGESFSTITGILAIASNVVSNP
jgi:hypothetical protein